jgi:surface antigen
MKIFTVFSVAVLLATSACSPHMSERERTGAILGGVIGGLAGSAIGEGHGQLVAVGAGTLLGAIIGGEIGRALDETDRRLMAETTGRALEYSRSNTVLIGAIPIPVIAAV